MTKLLDVANKYVRLADTLSSKSINVTTYDDGTFSVSIHGNKIDSSKEAKLANLGYSKGSDGLSYHKKEDNAFVFISFAKSK